MRFVRVGPVGQERSFVVDRGRWYAMSEALEPEFFAGGPERVRAQLAARELMREEPGPQERIAAPWQPRNVLCIGQNYAAHALESGAAPPDQPILFLKTTNTIAGPYDDVIIPKGAEKVDWEVELGVVIGPAAWRLPRVAAATQHIAGFVLANDLSERAWQLESSGGQWSKGKCAPGFTPLGPWVVTADDFEASDVGLRSWVDGEPRQDSTTADMIFSAAAIVHHLSQHLRLDPGDLVLTGTPEGVALSGRFDYLRPGSVVEVEIDGLGRQRQVCVSEGGHNG